MAALRFATVATAVILASCGDPVVDDAFFGQPLVTLNLTTQPGTPPPTAQQNPTASLFWDPTPGVETVIDDLAEQPGASLEVRLTTEFRLHLFSAPSAAHRNQADPRWALGRLAVYNDVEGDGMYNGEDSLLGTLNGAGILWAGETIPAADSPTGQEIEPGLHRVLLPLLCGAEIPELPEVSDANDCDVPMGEPCRARPDCGTAGYCFLSLNETWGGGHCGVLHPAPVDPCRPENANFVPGRAGRIEVYGGFLRACETTEQCRETESMTYCDGGWGVCIPARLSIPFSGEPTIAGSCWDQQKASTPAPTNMGPGSGPPP